MKVIFCNNQVTIYAKYSKRCITNSNDFNEQSLQSIFFQIFSDEGNIMR